MHISAGLGTHIDSPMHVIQGGNSVAEIIPQPEYKGIILDFEDYFLNKNNFTITKDVFQEKLKLLELNSLEKLFIVVKTGWGKFWGEKKYFNEYIFPHLESSLGEFFCDEKIAGIGIDTLSPEKITQSMKCPIHEALLSKNIWIVENIANLDYFSDTKGTFLVSPLRIVSSESPIRLFFKINTIS